MSREPLPDPEDGEGYRTALALIAILGIWMGLSRLDEIDREQAARPMPVAQHTVRV